jgi:hypothetical protein
MAASGAKQTFASGAILHRSMWRSSHRRQVGSLSPQMLSVTGAFWRGLGDFRGLIGRWGSKVPKDMATRGFALDCYVRLRALAYVEKVRTQFLSLRHYDVLHCILLFESTAKTTSSAIEAAAASSAMLPLVTAQTVAFDRGFGGWISRGRTHGRQAQAARRRTRNSARQIP